MKLGDMKGLNRRRSIRQRSLLLIKLSIQGAAGWVESKVFNCHKNGVCFLSDIPCSPGEKLEIMAFNMAEKMPADVVWCQPETDMTGFIKMFKVGVKYSFQ